MSKLVAGVFFVSLLVAVPGPAVAQCDGCDCDGDAVVSVSDLIRAVNIALGSAPIDGCPLLCPVGRICIVSINQLIRCVNYALNGCPEEPTPSPQPTQSPGPVCTPPPCAAGEVIVCGNAPEGCPGGCGSVCATPTPSFTTTPVPSFTPTQPSCGTPTGCATFGVLVETPGACPFCATRTPTSSPAAETPTPTAEITDTPCPVPTCPTFTVVLGQGGLCPRCVTPSPTRTRTPTCAPTGTPYCSELPCQPCPTIRPFCNVSKCGRCVTPRPCDENETCVPGLGAISGCCGCRTNTPTP